MPRNPYSPPRPVVLSVSLPDRQVGIAELCCPQCAASFAPLSGRYKREPIPVQFRCPPGQHPQAYVVACPSCNREYVICERAGLFGFVAGDVTSHRQRSRDHAREQVAVRVRARQREDVDD
jgi:hypothetical protein